VGGERGAPHAAWPKIWHSPDGIIKLQTIHVNIFFVNMHNSLFTLFILFDVFHESQLIY